MRKWVYIFAFLLLWGNVIASQHDFSLNSQIEATNVHVKGTMWLTMAKGDNIYKSFLRVHSHSETTFFILPDIIQAGEKQKIDFVIPSKHQFPGTYHLLVELIFQDKAGEWISSSLGLEYVHQSSRLPTKKPRVDIQNGKLTWLSLDKVQSLGLYLSASPLWQTIPELTPSSRQLELEESGWGKPLANFTYPQQARLTWVENGYHQSHLFRWQFSTAMDGKPLWQSYLSLLSEIKIEPKDVIFGVGLGCFLIAGLLIVRGKQRAAYAIPWLVWWLVPLSASIWIAHIMQFPLWSTDTLTTGGDTGSHVFYAHVFEDWIAQGQISGWLPEVFTGLAAFQYYFPLPFVLMAFLAKLTGMAIAFKWISMLPVALMPLAIYWTAGCWKWSHLARSFAVFAVCGFLLTGSTTIWGGNLLSVLSGEFTYAWGVLFSILMLGSMAKAVESGGRWWLLVVLLEIAVALSHGYALLFSGFALFVYALVSQAMGKVLFKTLLIHSMAFLCLGFWLFPLFEHHAWTIANDTYFHTHAFDLLWPDTLWPFLIGIPFVVVGLIKAEDRPKIIIPLVISFIAIALYLLAQAAHLADIRFYPYVQLFVLITLAGAFGLWLSQYKFIPDWLVTIGIACLLVFYWQDEVKKPSDWAKWNLQGYETKPLYPVFKQVAEDLKGGLNEPRIAFEHDLSNSDLGSNRNLEALPLFGTRPVLEGLYMESAVSGPFIYQLQAEISEQPSSPLSRFPSVKDSPERAIQHMKELYTDTILLRSKQMKERFKDHPAFEVLSERPPFLLLRLKEEVRMIEVLNENLIPETREDWLQKSFQRFRFKSDETRQVYLKEDEVLPYYEVKKHVGAIEFDIEREQIRFQTQHIGQPHLIKMTYHPKWKSLNGETIYLTEPAYMLIFPEHETVTLEYGLTWFDIIGRIASALGILLILFAWFLYKPTPTKISDSIVQYLLVVFLLIGIWLLAYASSPERSYHQGHVHVNQQEWLEAAENFVLAIDERSKGAQQAEAIFWAARSYQIGKKSGSAKPYYQRILEDYPANYWAPESAYRLIEMSDELGLDKQKYIEIMQRDYAYTRWYEMLEKQLGHHKK